MFLRVRRYTQQQIAIQQVSVRVDAVLNFQMAMTMTLTIQWKKGWSTLFLLDKGTGSEVTSPTSHSYRSDALTSFLILFADWILQSRLANPVLCHGRRLMLPAHTTGQQNETLSWNAAVSTQSRLLIWKVGEYNPLAVHLLLTTPYTQWMWDGQSHKQC